MTTTKFATEWLWLMGCMVISTCGSFVFLAREEGGELQETLLLSVLFGVLAGVALYAILGVVRITIWAIDQTKP